MFNIDKKTALCKIFINRFYISMIVLTASVILLMFLEYGTLYRRALLYGIIPMGTIRVIAGMGIGLIVHEFISTRESLCTMKINQANMLYMLLMVGGLVMAIICKNNMTGLILFIFLAQLLHFCLLFLKNEQPQSFLISI